MKIEVKEVQTSYSDENLKPIYERLRSQELKYSGFKEKVISAAKVYGHMKKQRESSFTPKQTITKLTAFAKTQQKALEQFQELMDDFYISQGFTRCFVVNRALEKVMSQREYSEDEPPVTEELSKYVMMELIAFAEGLARVNPQNNFGMPKGFPLEDWLRQMHSLFEDSPVEFTQGKYHQGIGYVSECIDILFELIKHVDNTVTHTNLAEKVKGFNRT